MKWYALQGHDKKLAPRCRYANMHKCPRFYQSYALLGRSGITTSLSPADDAALMAKWQKSDLWPAIAEHATSISGSDGKKSQFSNFCPEVTFDTFGLFASSLCRYTDESDREATETWLLNHGRSFAEDWRWEWASVIPMHYTECPLYSQINASHSIDRVHDSSQKIFKKIWNDPVWSSVIAALIISIATGSYFLFFKKETATQEKIPKPSVEYRVDQNNTKKNSGLKNSINIDRSNNATINQTQNVKTDDSNAVPSRLKEALKSLDSIDAYLYSSIDYEPDKYQSLLSRARMEIKYINDIRNRTQDLILKTYDCYHEAGEIWNENSPSALLTQGVTSLYDVARNQFHMSTLPKLHLKWKECAANLKKAHEYFEIEQ
ncbi:MAG: hypothetical protein HZA11_00735 [Nitrospirae bacterium]|nr:hypothetical protein [Nitrospirota bacterium]